MYVLHAWKSSLQLFKPANLKLFLLVTLKLLKSTYKRYFTYGWPFLLFIGLSGLIYNLVDGMGKYFGILEAMSQGWYTSVDIIWIIGILCYALLLMLAMMLCTFLVSIFARSSVDQKNYAYVKQYTKKYFAWYVLQSLLYFFLMIVGFVGGYSVGIEYFLLYIMYIESAFSVLFLLDLGGGFNSFAKSIWFGIKMAFYNLPFVCIMALLLYTTSLLHVPGVITTLIYPLWFCLVANYYTKKVHDQARLYQGS